MGYKNKTWLKESQEAPFFVLEKGIYKNLNVSTLGYVVSMSDDERLDKKVKKYKVKAGPIITGKTEEDYTIYDVSCLSHITITQEEINSGKCIVMVAFLDTNPKNFYKSINSANVKVEDKLSNDLGVENILHDYRNGVIVGKLKNSDLLSREYIPEVVLTRKYNSSESDRYQVIQISSGKGFNPLTDMFWMYVYKETSKKIKVSDTEVYRVKSKKYIHPISESSAERPISINWRGEANDYTYGLPTEWVSENSLFDDKGLISCSSRLFTFDQIQSLGESLAIKTKNSSFVHLGFRVVRLSKGVEVPELGPMTYCRLRIKYAENLTRQGQDSRLVGEWDLEIHSK
jgi:hypothetical protein